jgi:hypothetical protein
MTTRLEFDTEAISDQVAGVVDSMAFKFPEGVPDELVGEFLGLASEVTLGETTATIGADGTLQITCALWLGNGLERFASAVRAFEMIHAG